MSQAKNKKLEGKDDKKDNRSEKNTPDIGDLLKKIGPPKRKVKSTVEVKNTKAAKSTSQVLKPAAIKPSRQEPKIDIVDLLKRTLPASKTVNDRNRETRKPPLFKSLQESLIKSKPGPKISRIPQEQRELLANLRKTLPKKKPGPKVSEVGGEGSKLARMLETALPRRRPGPKVTRTQKPADSGIVGFLEKSLPAASHEPEVLEVGEVAYIGDGICKIVGLPNARIDDVLSVKTDKEEVLVLVLGISNDLVESVVLGDYFFVKKGNLVFSTNRTLKVPSGAKVLGRVISPIGRPLDGKGEVEFEAEMNVERPAPAVYMRTPIVDQMRSGFLVIDSIIPVGKGQRELVTGDRKTGKTRLMADIICNLKGKNIICVYVAVGAQKAKVKSFAQYLEKRGALEYTAIVMGSSDDPPSLNYLAPYAGSAVAEYFCDHAKDVLVIYDDLSKHAKAYRQMSLLLKRSPGRDAYPGDIFYLHSRLLERSAKVLPQYGGGSITALPMCETQNGDISEYITTNLMSITDGHIYLDAQLMHDGVFPAVNSGSSVSRIGGSIQPLMLRNLAALAGTQLARYNEVKSYETMNTEITEETEREINRGKRILEFFNQPSGVNYTPTEETILLYIVTGGLIDFVPLDVVAKLKTELVDFYRANLTEFELLTKTCDGKDKDLVKKSDGTFAIFIEAFINRTNGSGAQALKESWQRKKDEEAAKSTPPVATPAAQPTGAGEKK